MLAQFIIGLSSELRTGSGGYVVHDNGRMHSVGNVSIVLNQTGLGGLIIIRCHDQQAVCTAGLCIQRQIQSGTGAVATGTGNDLYPVIDFLDTVLNGGLVLFDGLG